MGHTCNSIIIHAPYEAVFDISNDIPRWTELFGSEYRAAVVTRRTGNELEFRLTNEQGQSWQSWRLLLRDSHLAYAERRDPKFPFEFMKIVWLYTPRPEGIELTWIQHFKMAEGAKVTEEQVETMINRHSRENPEIFKRVIEREAAPLPAPKPATSPVA